MLKFGNPPYLECSSKGDKRFSAFYAKVNGVSIEDQYQTAKIFADEFGYTTNLPWWQAKGKRAINQTEVAALYSLLWDKYIEEHPELLKVICESSGFSDIFGQPGHVCQAEEMWRIKQKCQK